MKKLTPALAVLALSASAQVWAAGVPSKAIDQITLAYLNAKVYASGAVSCNAKAVAGRDYVGCFNRSLNGKSDVALWLFEGEKFKAINGTARGFADGKLRGIGGIENMPLPLPKDIDVGAAVAAFK